MKMVFTSSFGGLRGKWEGHLGSMSHDWLIKSVKAQRGEFLEITNKYKRRCGLHMNMDFWKTEIFY